jgi:hypothetical protein
MITGLRAYFRSNLGGTRTPYVGDDFNDQTSSIVVRG